MSSDAKKDKLSEWSKSEECKYLVDQATAMARREIKFDSCSIPTPFGNIELGGFELNPDKMDAEMKLYNGVLESTVKNVASFMPPPLPSTVDQPVATAAVEALPKQPTAPTLFKLGEMFHRNQLASKKWTRVKTGNGYLSTIKLFEKFFGDRPIQTYTEREAENFREFLQKIPSGWQLHPKTKELSYEEAIQLKRPKLTQNAVRDHLIRINAVFKFAKKKKYLAENIFDDITVEKQKGRKREPFTKEELYILFEEQNFLAFQHAGYPSRYFAPLLAAFTGARRSELFFLDVDSVYMKHGIWLIDINDFGEDDEENPNKMKRVKNDGSIRVVPLHNKLIKLGFLDYVNERRKDRKDKRLFKEYNVVNEQAGHGFSIVFGKWIRKTAADLGEKRGKLFPRYRGIHSFRHLFISESREREISEAAARVLTGHTIPDDTHTDYGGERSETLQKKRLLALNDELQNMDPSEYFPPLPTYPEMMKLFR